MPAPARLTRALCAATASLALLACAGSPEPEAADAPDPAASERAIDAYLERVRDFGVNDTLEAYALGDRADALTPELMRRLETPPPPEDRDASEAHYHLIRLGCVWIREADLSAGHAEALHHSLDDARRSLRPGTRDPRAADFELESCQPGVAAPEQSELDTGAESGETPA